MPSDQLVTARVILDALLEYKRHGSRQALEDLEKLEPDLAEYLMENLSMIYQGLLNLGGRAAHTRKVYQQIQSLNLICIRALRNSHYALWRQEAADTPLAKLDPTLGPHPGASPPDPPEA